MFFKFIRYQYNPTSTIVDAAAATATVLVKVEDEAYMVEC